MREDSAVLKKQIKPNFKTLGPKFGQEMKLIASKIGQFSANDIKEIEQKNCYHISYGITIELVDVEISSADIPGFSVATNNGITVALDITLSEELKEEGLAREFINRVQSLRKDKGFEVTDKVAIWVEKNDLITSSIKNNFTYICEETLAEKLNYEETIISNAVRVELIDGISITISLEKN